MNLLGFNIQISRNPKAALESPGLGSKAMAFTPEEWLSGEGAARTALSNAYEQVVWVYRAINVLAEQVANIPFLFSAGERGREQLITTGPLPDFYARPHPHLNRFQYWELRVIWLMLRGECFRIPIYADAPGAGAGPGGPRARLKQILIPDPAQFQHIVEDHQLIGWRYTGFGPGTPLAGQVFLPEEVWFERLPNPFDFWRGLPPLHVAARAAETDFAAGCFMRGIIENNADPGVIVRTDKWISKEQREQIFAALRERKRRAGCADKPVIVAGMAEVIRPQLSSSDLQFLENRKFSRAEICAAFGVPEEILITTDHAKYDVMSGARLNFIENRIGPLCARLEAEEQITVKSLDPQASGWFDLDSLPILQEARRSRLAAAKTGFDMGVPFNELNRVLDLGFKPLPWGDRGYVSSSLQPLEGRAGTPQPAEVSRITPGADLRALPAPQQANPAAGAGGEPLARAADLLSTLKPAEPPARADATRLQSKLRRFLFEQRGRVLAAFEKPDLATTGAAALIEPADEDEKLLRCLQPLEPGPESLEAVREFVRQTIACLQLELAAAIAQGETSEQLAARTRAFYNEAAALAARQL